MWAQLQKVSSKPEKEAELLDVFGQLRAIEQADSGLLKTMVMRSQADPTLVFVLVVYVVWCCVTGWPSAWLRTVCSCALCVMLWMASYAMP